MTLAQAPLVTRPRTADAIDAAVSDALMFTGLYPLLPHAWRALAGHDLGDRPVRTALVEWGASAVLSVAPGAAEPVVGVLSATAPQLVTDIELAGWAAGAGAFHRSIELIQ